MVRKTVFRLIVLVLVAVLWLPVGRVSGSEGQSSRSLGVEELAAVIEEQVRVYAASIDQSKADSNAAADLAAHGMTGRGKTLKMDKSDALTAAIMNSELVMEGFASNLTYIIRAMQRLDIREIPGVTMSFGWYGSDSRYYAFMENESTEYPGNLDWLVTREPLKGKRNSYDSSLDWMVGDCYVYVDIGCVADHGDEKTYQITAVFDDRFDFNTAKTSGFKKLLSGLGMLLFKEFDWTCTVSFAVTVPYSYDNCTHKSGSYRWIYENETMTSREGDGFIGNETTALSHTDANGKEHRYFELDKTIRLLHNKPWVVEYDSLGVSAMVLSPVDNAVTKSYPMLQQSARTQICFRTKEYTMATKPETGSLDRYYAYHYVGTGLLELFPYQSTRYYTFRVENVPDNKGGNKIYLTVTDMETGEICLDRIPMDDYYYDGTWTTEMLYQNSESDFLSGRDIFVNYLGYKTTGFKAKWMDLRIWEEGEGNPDVSYFVENRVEATCTEKGSVVKTCSRCGFAAEPEIIEALGHDWVEADCLNAKTCRTCGATEGKALGHDFSEWEIAVPAECEKEGERVRVCHCGVSETEKMEALSHEYVKGSCVLCGELDPECLMGDVDFDGKLSYNDALKVLRYSIGLEALENPAVADITGDGKVNYEDALAILRASIGL